MGKINTSIANSGLAALVHYLSVCVFPSHFFLLFSKFVIRYSICPDTFYISSEEAFAITFFYPIPSISLPICCSIFYFFSDFGAALHIVHLCTILHCLCIRHCLYMSSKYVLFFFILFFCRAFSRMLDFLIFRSSQSKREKVKQQQQKLIAKIFNYSVFGGSESAWKFIFVVQLFAWV